MAREDVFICNVLKCRPPGNRDPQPNEIESCEPYLAEQVRLIQPRVVCTLGNFATKLLTRSQTGITKVRGVPQVHELGGRSVFVLPLFHPAAALRTPAVADQLRADFERMPDLLEQPLPQVEQTGAVQSGNHRDTPAAGQSPTDRSPGGSLAAEDVSRSSLDQLDLLG